MAVKELLKPAKNDAVKNEKKIEEFISKGGGLANVFEGQEGDHRLTLRIPKRLIEKIDRKRKERIGSISRNLWILEVIDKAAR